MATPPTPLHPHGSLRKHQARAQAVAREIVGGKRHQKVIVAGITPGGGKTLMAALFTHELAEAGLIEQVLVVVPNDPLRQQMVEGFHDPKRGLDRYLSAPGVQQSLPGTGRPFGQAITYQRLTNERESKRIATWCSKKPTLVVFDECHHLCVDKAWERGASRAVEASKLALCMSGTLWRWDEERIPFINYDESGKALIDIRYSRAEALAEKAVLPVEFRFFDGEAIYEHGGREHKVTLSQAVKKERARSLKTSLKSPDYAERFIVESLGEWERYRQQYYPSSAIVVCHDQKAAKRAMAVAKKHFARHAPALSLHGESQSDRAIKKFRAGEHAILVTVRKAYEGLDVPGATHLVYLGDSRSWPFLDQVIARVTRFNRNAPLAWEEQRGHVYTPDDRDMREYVGKMLEDQAEYFREKERGLGTSAAPKRSTFRPDTANVTEINYGVDGRPLTTEENIGVRELDRLYPQMRAPLSDRLDMARRMGLIPLAPGETDAAE
jgi:superfamily II DNA or RNA helicase